jgi:hypothetical protein
MKPTPQRRKASKASTEAVSLATTPSGADEQEASARPIDPAQREALVRLAAYSFYERRGLVGGHELEDWLQAEMEVDRQLVSGAQPTLAS